MYATITKKQAGVIFSSWKRGEIKTSEDAINMMYARFVGLSEQTTDAVIAECCSKLHSVIDSIFAHDGEADAKFNSFVEYYSNHFNDSIFAA